MKITRLDDIRSEFLDFFESKGHLVEKSYSLIPHNDKSLLLIGAGMAPLKRYFTGEATPPRTRMATSQKCMRTGDLENVGVTARHATFFEMLGNFSFGDYFKEEAIDWAWEFLTEVLELPKDKLWASVYLDDDEAYDIWKDQIGIPEDRIVRLGKEDNFWELEVGPAGPCSEIHIDRGEEYGCDNPDCKPGCDCDRYLELWNLVFTQFDKDEDGVYHPLENKNIDTGMGLERITAYMQGADNIFEIEEVQRIIRKIEDISGYKYKTDGKSDMAVRVITDHIRSACFMVSDTILPSNEGRGYVLRRIMRRAIRYGRLIGITDDFLYILADEVIDEWKGAYPELEENKDMIKSIIKKEEERFSKTLDTGVEILDSYIQALEKENKDTLSGKDAFKLYDTYGFPLELTEEILKERGLSVDKEDFKDQMQAQRDRARSAIDTKGQVGWKSGGPSGIDEGETEFVGYEDLVTTSEVLSIYVGGNRQEVLDTDDEAIIVLDKTGFYGESGGQLGDLGLIYSDEAEFDVIDTQKSQAGAILHTGRLKSGRIQVGDVLEARVQRDRRNAIVRNHTATHLVHAALRKILGDHVSQQGSQVREDGFRFDFSHFGPVKDDELRQIEELVNDYIYSQTEAKIYYLPIEEAHKSDAIGLFEDSYGDTVRIVEYPGISKELCGGTHVQKTSDIGIFKILSEQGIAADTRRIEATTGKNVYKILVDLVDRRNTVQGLLGVGKDDIRSRVEGLIEENKDLKAENQKLIKDQARENIDDLLNSYREINGVKVLAARIDGLDVGVLRDMTDELRDKLKSAIIVLATSNDGKVNFTTAVSEDLIKQGYKAGDIIKQVAAVAGGGGGGRPNMATAGAKDPSKIDQALDAAYDIIAKI